MHYRNGRLAKAGDMIINLNDGKTGVLHSLSSTSDTCNGRLAPVSNNDSYLNIKDCLHLDDIKANADKISTTDEKV